MHTHQANFCIRFARAGAFFGSKSIIGSKNGALCYFHDRHQNPVSNFLPYHSIRVETNKMNLMLKPLKTYNKDIASFEKINKEAFPIPEYISITELFTFANQTNTDILGIYDRNTPVGFFVLVKNNTCGYVYFFAIDQSLRSQGYGSSAIKELIRRYPELQLILDFEEIDEKAENNNQRIRRKQFYLRNGFTETNRYTLLKEDRFEVVCNNPPLNEKAFQDILNILHHHRSDFPDILL